MEVQSMIERKRSENCSFEGMFTAGASMDECTLDYCTTIIGRSMECRNLCILNALRKLFLPRRPRRPKLKVTFVS